jgi:hypothetical protein
MGRTALDIADIVRIHRLDLETVQPLSPEQGRALSAIALCRTAALGGHQGVCLECDLKADPSYNSCRNRNCPKCQALAQERWIANRARTILPVPHFHGVFTLPENFRALARLYPREIYAAMFSSTIAALLDLARSRLGIVPGLTLVLHTWTRELAFHPHLHVLISAGGLILDGSAFKRVHDKFLVHVKPLAKRFKTHMMDALRALKTAGVLEMAAGAFGGLMASLWNQDWNVHVKKAFRSSSLVLKYLGRYTHRVGIANSRLLDVNSSQVTFRTKCGRKISLPPVTFLRRFLQHVLPDGFKKIRHAGLYAAFKALAKAKAILGTPEAPPPTQPTWQEALLTLTGVDAMRCRGCGALLAQSILLPARIHSRRPRAAIPRSPP